MIETCRTSVQSWECDSMGHMNVQVYVARASEGLLVLANALGISPSQRRAEHVGFVETEHHIKFLRELRPGHQYVVSTGILELQEQGLRTYQEIWNPAVEELCTTFQANTTFMDLRTRTPKPLPEDVARHAEAFMVQLPPHGAVRGLDQDPPIPGPTLDDAERLGLRTVYRGVVGPQQCDAYGFMETYSYMGRISDAMTNIVGLTQTMEQGSGVRTGGAALEYRFVYRQPAQDGDLIQIRSGLKRISGRKTFIWGHWLFDSSTGEAVASAEAVSVLIDLVQRRAIEIPEKARAGMAKIAISDLRV
jgi:acyl-CoA thioester hydrolase